MIEVRTQQELEAAVKKHPDEWIYCIGSAWFSVSGTTRAVAWGNSTVEAWGNSTVRAWENSTVRARGNSTVEAWGNSTVRAWGNSTVEAWGNSTVEAWGNSTVEATGAVHVAAWHDVKVQATDLVAVHRHGDTPRISGGVLIQVPPIETPEQWCEFYDVEVENGTAVLYKAVDDNWYSSGTSSLTGKKVAYAPGSTPEADDWDGGRAECGGGLHFAFHPSAAAGFFPEATRYVGCPVALADIVVHKDPSYPQKIKAHRVVAPGCFEVDRHGKPVEPAVEGS